MSNIGLQMINDDILPEIWAMLGIDQNDEDAQRKSGYYASVSADYNIEKNRSYIFISLEKSRKKITVKYFVNNVSVFDEPCKVSKARKKYVVSKLKTALDSETIS